MQEVWLPVVGFEEYYLISNTGRIFSIRSQRELIVKPKHTGYMDIELNINGKVYYKRIHRLVAEAFIPNPENKPYINHKDGNKLNNNVTNLEWCTNSENMIHAFQMGLELPQYQTYYLYNHFISQEVVGLDNLAKITGYNKSWLLQLVKNKRVLEDRNFKGFHVSRTMFW